MIKQCVELESITGLTVADRNFLLGTKRIEMSGQGYRFVCSGVFSTPYNTFVVIPWVAMSHTGRVLNATDPCSLMITTFDWLKRIANTGSIRHLDIKTGREFVLHALLQHMVPLIENGLRYNVFRSDHEVLNSIRGKWDLTKDLKQGVFPTLFSCEVQTCDQNHSILSVARKFCNDLGSTAESQIIRNKAIQLQAVLTQITNLPEDPLASLREAEFLSTNDRRFHDWLPWLQLLRDNVSIKHDQINFAGQGLPQDFELNTALFFELAVEQIFQHLEYSPRAQESGSILGGSTWLWNDITSEGEEPVLKAHNRSRPDFLIESKYFNMPILVECKYKKLEVVSSGLEPLKQKKIRNFNSHDRNQLLSFVLSRSQNLKFDTSFMVVVYPTRDVDPDTPILCFEARAESAGESEVVRWGYMAASQTNVRVHFFGLDVMRALDEMHSRRDGPELTRLRYFLRKGATVPNLKLAQSS